MIEQISVLLENSHGRLAELTRTLKSADIDMHALTTADTAQFGVIRIICDTPQAAYSLLKSKDFSVTLNSVVAVKISDSVGALSQVFDTLDSEKIDIEYSYCFVSPDGNAATVLKSKDQDAEEKLSNTYFKVFAPADLYTLDV